MNLKPVFSFLILVLMLCPNLQGQEREYIQSFDVDIKLKKDRSIEVVENIEVNVLGDRIKRGITRSLPTYRKVEGQKFSTRYKNVKILRDGKVEPFSKKRVNGSLIYYIGDEHVFLNPGQYNYTITYDVPNQLFIEADGVQLRWNAIGLDVIFNSKNVKVNVLSEEILGLEDAKMYVGKYGSDEDSNRVDKTISENQITFDIPDGLQAYEAATIEINLPSGSVAEPTFFERKSSLLTLALGGLAMLFYFVITWIKYGMDPKPNPSALLYDTPQSLSPASINYIHKERVTSRALTGSFISLAVKGYIRIEKEGKSGLFSSEIFVIHKLKSPTSELPAEEASLLTSLFSSRDTVFLDGEYNPIVNQAKQAHRSAVQVQHRAFVKEGNNLKFILYPILILIVVLVASSILANTIEINSYPHFSNLAWFLPLSIIGILLYRYLIIQPTIEKLNLQEEIRAFRQYIAMNISEVTQLENPPIRDIDHFESLLPYAYALDVESDWSNSFSEMLTQSNYAPSWSGGHFYPIGIHSGLSRGVASTATKPQSSSGGGSGGGFSGGGGGGGGVGGW